MTYQTFWHDIESEKSPCDFLSGEEELKLLAYKSKEKAHSFKMGRNWLRFHLAENLKKSPKDLKILETENGKPYLDGNELYFNISHKSSKLLIGISKKPIGVDIEKIAPRKNQESILKRFFHETCLTEFQILKEKEALNYFYHLWVAFEAYSKCIGTGVFGQHPFKSIASNYLKQNQFNSKDFSIVWEKSPEGFKSAIAYLN